MNTFIMLLELETNGNGKKKISTVLHYNNWSLSRVITCPDNAGYANFSLM